MNFSARKEIVDDKVAHLTPKDLVGFVVPRRVSRLGSAGETSCDNFSGELRLSSTTKDVPGVTMKDRLQRSVVDFLLLLRSPSQTTEDCSFHLEVFSVALYVVISHLSSFS